MLETNKCVDLPVEKFRDTVLEFENPELIGLLYRLDITYRNVAVLKDSILKSASETEEEEAKAKRTESINNLFIVLQRIEDRSVIIKEILKERGVENISGIYN